MMSMTGSGHSIRDSVTEDKLCRTMSDILQTPSYRIQDMKVASLEHPEVHGINPGYPNNPDGEYIYRSDRPILLDTGVSETGQNIQRYGRTQITSPENIPEGRNHKTLIPERSSQYKNMESQEYIGYQNRQDNRLAGSHGNGRARQWEVPYSKKLEMHHTSQAYYNIKTYGNNIVENGYDREPSDMSEMQDRSELTPTENPSQVLSEDAVIYSSKKVLAGYSKQGVQPNKLIKGTPEIGKTAALPTQDRRSQNCRTWIGPYQREDTWTRHNVSSDPRLEHNQRDDPRLEQNQRDDPRVEHNQVDDPRLAHNQRDDPRLKHNQRNDPRIEHNNRNDPRIEHNHRGDPRIEHNQRDDPRLEYNQVDDPRLEHNKVDDPRVEHNQVDDPRLKHNQRDDPRLEHNQRDDPRIEHNNRNDPRIEHNHRGDLRIEHNHRDDPRIEHNQRDDPRLEHIQRDDPRLEHNNRNDPRIEHNQRNDPRIEHNQRDDPRIEHNQRDEPGIVHNQRGNPRIDHNQKGDPRIEHNQRSDPRTVQNQRNDPSIVHNQRDDPRTVHNQRDDPVHGQRGKSWVGHLQRDERQRGRSELGHKNMGDPRIQHCPKADSRILGNQINYPRKKHNPNGDPIQGQYQSYDLWLKQNEMGDPKIEHIPRGNPRKDHYQRDDLSIKHNSEMRHSYYPNTEKQCDYQYELKRFSYHPGASSLGESPQMRNILMGNGLQVNNAYSPANVANQSAFISGDPTNQYVEKPDAKQNFRYTYHPNVDQCHLATAEDIRRYSYQPSSQRTYTDNTYQPPSQRTFTDNTLGHSVYPYLPNPDRNENISITTRNGDVMPLDDNKTQKTWNGTDRTHTKRSVSIVEPPKESVSNETKNRGFNKDQSSKSNRVWMNVGELTFKRLARQLSQPSKEEFYIKKEEEDRLGPRPNNYFDLSVFACCCCLSPFGFAAVIISVLGDMRYRERELDRAKRHSKTSLILSVVGIISTILVAIVLLLTNKWPVISGGGS